MRQEGTWGAIGKGLLVSKRDAERLGPDFLVARSFLDVMLQPPRGHEKGICNLEDVVAPQFNRASTALPCTHPSHKSSSFLEPFRAQVSGLTTHIHFNSRVICLVLLDFSCVL